MPPPRLTSSEWRVAPSRCSSAQTWLTLSSDLLVSPAAMLITLAPWALRLFTEDAAVLRYALQMMWYFAPFYVLWVCIDILSNVLRGAGDSIRPMIISLVGVCLLRILWVLFVVPRWNTIDCVSLSYPFTWCVTALAFLIYYRHSPWLDRCRHQAAKSLAGKQA